MATNSEITYNMSQYGVMISIRGAPFLLNMAVSEVKELLAAEGWKDDLTWIKTDDQLLGFRSEHVDAIQIGDPIEELGEADERLNS